MLRFSDIAITSGHDRKNYPGYTYINTFSFTSQSNSYDRNWPVE